MEDVWEENRLREWLLGWGCWCDLRRSGDAEGRLHVLSTARTGRRHSAGARCRSRYQSTACGVANRPTRLRSCRDIPREHAVSVSGAPARNGAGCAAPARSKPSERLTLLPTCGAMLAIGPAALWRTFSRAPHSRPGDISTTADRNAALTTARRRSRRMPSALRHARDAGLRRAEATPVGGADVIPRRWLELFARLSRVHRRRLPQPLLLPCPYCDHLFLPALSLTF